MSDTLSTLDHLVRRHEAGTVLFREGEKGEKMYVIRSGRVCIWKLIQESEVTLAVLGPGEFFGEMALLEGLPRSASATVLDEARLIEVEKDAFEVLVRTRGEIAVRLMRRLSARLREADRQIQLLMSRSGAARALSLLRSLAGPPGAEGLRQLPVDLGPAQLAVRVGLPLTEARDLLARFERTGLLRRQGGAVFLAPEELVQEFLLYVELREQYDPVDVRELADMAGLPEEEAHKIMKRLIAARLAEAQRTSPLRDTYSTYLALKQRFEYAD